ncbi:MAG: glycosyltransferase family 2 protein [Miltoncostaeaceae bacterium]
MAVAVIVVTYNQGPEVSALFDALGETRREGDEIIVVDNESADGTADLAEGHDAVDRVVRSGANVGFGAACNAGARASEADTLVFLNPDCVPEPDFMKEIRRGPAEWSAWMGLVTLADGAHVNTAGGVAHFTGLAWAGRYGEPVDDVPPSPHLVGFLSGACLAVRRPVFDELGGFCEDFFLYGEDVELSHRLRLAGHRFGVVPAARVRHDYDFHKGDLKWELLERNRALLVLRTYPGPVLRLAAPALVAIELFLIPYAFLSGWGGAKLRALSGVLRRLPAVRAERRRVQATDAVEPVEFALALSGRLSSPFLGGVGRSGPVNALLGAYWDFVIEVLRRRQGRGDAGRPSG